MRSQQTTGIILNRLNFGEADRIITLITPDHGKLRLLARGVRKEKSKLAGGIELFSISNISFIAGKRDIGTLVSTRLLTHYGEIVKDLKRTQLGYDFLKLIDKSTPDNSDVEYYELLVTALTLLGSTVTELGMVENWFCLRLLQLMGHEPNLQTDNTGSQVEAGKKYQFDFENMAFFRREQGKFRDKHIKLLRLMLTQSPNTLMHIEGLEKLTNDLRPLIKTMLNQFVSG